MNLFWHQRDLRIPDNRGLFAAARDETVLPVYVLDSDVLGGVGKRQRAFLLEGVRALREAYRERGSDLLVRSGGAAEQLADIVEATDAATVYYNEHYRPSRRNRQRRVDAAVATESRTDLTLVDPARFDPGLDTHGQFHRRWQELPTLPPVGEPDSDALADVSFSAEVPVPAVEFELPRAGYEAARARLDSFIEDGIESYNSSRDDMAAYVARPTNSVSMLSPYLAAGNIGIRETHRAASEAHERATGRARKEVDKYRYELTWREHNYYLLYHHPTLLSENYKSFPNEIAWRDDNDGFEAWTRGKTGYPFVDAGMRQLERDGYIHNRPRQVVASFLTKHLLVDWRRGARWFAKRLVDHDPASNYGNWQWIASTGTDSVDVRIFDPVSQMSKYDDGADYVTEYVPELRGVEPGKLIDWPTLSDGERESLAPEYPHPIVDRNDGYERAQRVFEEALGKR